MRTPPSFFLKIVSRKHKFRGKKQAMAYCYLIATAMLLAISLMLPERPDTQVYFTNESDYLIYMLTVFVMIGFYAAGCMLTGAVLEARKRGKEENKSIES